MLVISAFCLLPTAPAIPYNIISVSVSSTIRWSPPISTWKDTIRNAVKYSAYGLEAVLSVCTVCFLCSAVMEIFIKIPFAK